jgi:hypothetical protein
MFNFSSSGAVAQLEERLHGMQEVVGSSPIGSTTPADWQALDEYRVEPILLPSI